MTASIHVDSLTNDLRRYEDQQLILVVLLRLLLEERTQNRDIAQPRHLGLIVTLRRLEDTAQHDGLTVVHEHLGHDLLRVDRGYVDAAGSDRDRADGVFLDVEVED